MDRKKKTAGRSHKSICGQKLDWDCGEKKDEQQI